MSYPADFFRSMEDASGVDLDWFWRGWFYSTDHVDIAISDLRHYQIDRGDPKETSQRKKAERAEEPESQSQKRNKKLPLRVDRFPELKDFYNEFDDLAVKDDEVKKFRKYLAGLTPKQRKLLGLKTHFYVIDLQNKGGLVMPVILKVTHEDDSVREIRLPAEVWVKNSQNVSRLIMSGKPITSVELDPHLETADVDRSNNFFPPKIRKSRFRLYTESKAKNEMQKAGLGKKQNKDTENGDDKQPPENNADKKSEDQTPAAKKKRRKNSDP